MSFGQEVKDFIGAFQAGSGMMQRNEAMDLERQRLKAQADYLLARQQNMQLRYGGGATTTDPATAAGDAARQQYYGSGGGGGKGIKASPEVMNQIKLGAEAVGKQLGIDPKDVLTVVSYETGGTFDPWQPGPRTKWGQHHGLIQWGEPQAKQYGVTPDMSPYDQMLMAGKYLKDTGVKPGMGLMDIYSAVNAGGVGRYNASDASAGGAPGTVRDKVNNQMAGHIANATRILAGNYGSTAAAPIQTASNEPQQAVPTSKPAQPATAVPASTPATPAAPEQAVPANGGWGEPTNLQPGKDASGEDLPPGYHYENGTILPDGATPETDAAAAQIDEEQQ